MCYCTCTVMTKTSIIDIILISHSGAIWVNQNSTEGDERRENWTQRAMEGSQNKNRSRHT